MTEKPNLQRTYVIVDIVYKAGTPIALAALFFLKSQFVTKTEYEQQRHESEAQISQIQTTLKIMAEQNRVNERQDASLSDHETRIRKLESRQ